MVKVDVAKRLKLNKRRKRLPIIYHKITANKTYSTINLQMRVTELEIFTRGVFFELSPQVDNPLNRLVVMAKYGSMMLAGDCDFIQVQQSLRKDLRTKCSKNNKIFQSLNCDFIQVVNDVAARDADWVDWFVGVDKVKNRTGDWFFGVAALRNDVRITAYSNSMV